MLKRIATLCVVLALLVMPATFAEGEQPPYRSYTYDTTGAEQPAPPLYLPASVWQAGLTAPSDLHIYEGALYILDGGENRLVISDLAMAQPRYLPLMRTAAVPMSFGQAGGLFVCASGIYVTDLQAQEVYAFDHSGILRATYGKPDSPMYDQTVPFQAKRVLADGAGNVYALVEGLYDGAVLFSPAGEFLGFFGANEVEMSVDMYIDQLWKRLLSDEQKDAMSRFVPVAYSSFDIDRENFVYTCTDNVAFPGLRVRKLNPSGKSLWNGENQMYGDLIPDDQYVEGLQNVTSFTDIAVDEQGLLSVLDSAKGRVFQYDTSGALMGVFGGKGSQMGTFAEPVALDAYEDRLYVLDGKDGSVTCFMLTDYGSAYRTAVGLCNDGEYVAAMPYWQEVLRQNAHSQAACVGMGKALYAKGEVDGALSYLRASGDREQYSQVFARWRLTYVREHFTAFALGLAAAVAAVLVLRKARWFGLGARLAPLRRHLSVMFHPVDGILEMQRKKSFSMLFSSAVVLLWLGVSVLEYFATGLPFNHNDPRQFNLLVSAVSTVLVFLLWTLVNWSVSTLSDGKGSAKEIYCASAYLLLPYLICRLACLALSHVFTLEEGAFLTWIGAVGLLWSAVLLFVIVMTIHHYSAQKTLGNLVLTAAGIVIVIFLLFVLVVLFEHVYGLIRIIYNELTLRR